MSQIEVDDSQARSHWAGDSRAAMVPFLAFRAFQEIGQTDWKWLFLGLDETLFFADAAYRIVRDLDSELPYVLSGDSLVLYYLLESVVSLTFTTTVAFLRFSRA